MKKRRQHYVWRTYLKPWASGDQVSCLRNGDIFPANIRDVANERDFYRLRDITQADLALIELFAIRHSPKFLQGQHRRLAANFAQLAHAYAAAPAGTPAEIAFRELLEEHVINFEEELHCAVEDAGLPHLQALREGDTSFFREDKAAMNLLYFLPTQYFRTKATREAVLTRMREVNSPFDLQPIWNVLTHIWSTNVGWSMYANRSETRLTILDNPTEVPFITGDQAMINLLGKGDGNPPDELAFYYPVSPTRAVVISDVEHPYSDERVTLCGAEVEALNLRLYRASFEQIYSNSKTYLESLAKA